MPLFQTRFRTTKTNTIEKAMIKKLINATIILIGASAAAPALAMSAGASKAAEQDLFVLRTHGDLLMESFAINSELAQKVRRAEAVKIPTKNLEQQLNVLSDLREKLFTTKPDTLLKRPLSKLELKVFLMKEAAIKNQAY